ncbi:hyoscyamine 6-dioxygenase-like [Quillaja saponaria]|uniref:Hyoscyamine 6-dioxygenase-like n=1 Tax=Quillaja saponaria TaxID=32244 RepID=A0AAD7VIS0_QUISA|nr:hyoscyamine 6-dioxygenase-like [Quillaja saponaria]
MAKLVSSWYNDVKIFPENYIFPLESRPGNITVPLASSIPVIDLSEANRTNTIQKILKAGEEFGFFQVINHGVSENSVNKAMKVFKEFFKMQAEDKESLYSEDNSKICRVYTSTASYATEEFHRWRDNLRHQCHPLEQYQIFWPEKPIRYQEYVRECSIEVKQLASRILELISEGLGIRSGYFDGELSESLLLSVNHYPPCPEPSLTWGASKHCDPGLITILIQDEIYGLQVLKNGEWIGVKPIANAFVVNVGYQLQIISNGKLKSVLHQVVANSSHARTSAAFFLQPLEDGIVEPAKALTHASNPPIYKSFKYKEFLSYYLSKNGDPEVALEPFKAT